jgi:lipopolysaccharide/colanic/teichoic acid biosynthesis glycosyltransferase
MWTADETSRLVLKTTSLQIDRRNPLSLRLKRTMDLIGSTTLLLLTWPLFLIFALAIKLDSPGPVYFRRRVAGQHGKLFDVLKFRSMTANAHESLMSDVELLERYRETLRIENDPRITRVGRFLRKTSLDELPQLFNVMKGQMSLVGPRMLGDIELARYAKAANAAEKVLAVKPGLASLWAVAGRKNICFERRIELDLDYVENWSIWLDIKILLKCGITVLSMVGAK